MIARCAQVVSGNGGLCFGVGGFSLKRPGVPLEFVPGRYDVEVAMPSFSRRPSRLQRRFDQSPCPMNEVPASMEPPTHRAAIPPSSGSPQRSFVDALEFPPIFISDL